MFYYIDAIKLNLTYRLSNSVGKYLSKYEEFSTCPVSVQQTKSICNYKLKTV